MKKIVIKVHMESDKFRSKAMKTAAAFQGVVSVSVEGESKDQIVVTGDKIDSVCMTRKLRKKFSYATLLSVADESASNNNEGGENGGEKKDEAVTTVEIENSLVACCYANNYPPPCPSNYVVYDPYPNNTCSIL